MGDRETLSAQVASAGESARAVLDRKHEAREVALRSSRRAIQACAASIRAVHRGEYADAERLSTEAAAHVSEAVSATQGHAELRHAGYVHDAEKEYAEARLTLAFVRGDELPTAEGLGVEVQPFLGGMAEAASELRRQILDHLRRGAVERSEDLLRVMEDVYDVLVTMDYPDALTGGLRRTTDALRAVLERTRGDLTTAILQGRLQASIERRLPEGEG